MTLILVSRRQFQVQKTARHFHSMYVICMKRGTRKPNESVLHSEAYAMWQWNNWLRAEAKAENRRCVMMNLAESAVPATFQQQRGNVVAQCFGSAWCERPQCSNNTCRATARG